MAGSDFSAFLELIGKVVLWVIYRTLDLLSLCFLVLSCALPWRLWENLSHFEFEHDWRCAAFVSDATSTQL